MDQDNVVNESLPMEFSQDSSKNTTKNDEGTIEKIERPPRNFQQLGNLRSVQEISEKYRDIFNFPYFNIIQSKVMDDVLYTDNSTVISAPTGSGKTAIFELAIIRLLMKAEDREIDYNFKIIYIAPVKALCTERMQDWHLKFSKFGINSMIMTSDTDTFDYQNFENFSIILTTPEKWDSVTRRWRESLSFVANIKLMLIDEVHLLNEEGRGAILEVVVTRMKIIRNLINRQENIVKLVRFMAVSATIPNIEDIAEWLGSQKEPAICYTISEELRPVKLNKIVKGYSCTPNTPPFKFDMNLTYKIKEVIMEYSCGKPILIFCATRKSVEMTSNYISQNLTFHLTPEQRRILMEAASQLVDNKMKIILSSGVGSHHAGMMPENRNIIENLFRDGNLPVLVTTSTLSMGVNLPANLVIIKSTMQYATNEYKEYTESALLQMIGRAGRPQFDTSATAVIMTSALTKAKYEKMVGGAELIESSLHNHLKEHLNSEIALSTITDFYEALNWLQMTFLFIRAQKNPKHYKLPPHLTKDKIEKKFLELCQIEMNDLANYGMIEQDFYTGIKPTNVGILMSKYYMNFETIKVFKEIKGNENLEQMVMVISKCNEFAETFLRRNDKGSLNTLNRCKSGQCIRFPLKGKIQTIAMKVNCMIQAVFGNLKIPNPSLNLESNKIMQIGERVSKCLVEYLENKEKCFSALLNAIILSKCFRARMWENSRLIATQLHGIGPVLATMLEVAGKITFKSMMETDPRELEVIMNRKPPLGNEIKEAIAHIPYYNLELLQTDFNVVSKIEIKVVLQNDDKIREKCMIHGGNAMYLIVGNNKNETLYYTKIYHNKICYDKEYKKVIEFDFIDNCIIKAYLISENWVGIDCDAQIEVEKYDSVGLSAAQHKNMANTDITGKITRKVIGKVAKTPKNSDAVTRNLILNYFQKTPDHRVTYDPIQNKFVDFNMNSNTPNLSPVRPNQQQNKSNIELQTPIGKCLTTITTMDENQKNFSYENIDLHLNNEFFSNVDPDKLSPEETNSQKEKLTSPKKVTCQDLINILDSQKMGNKFNFNKNILSKIVTIGSIKNENGQIVVKSNQNLHNDDQNVSQSSQNSSNLNSKSLYCKNTSNKNNQSLVKNSQNLPNDDQNLSPNSQNLSNFHPNISYCKNTLNGVISMNCSTNLPSTSQNPPNGSQNIGNSQNCKKGPTENTKTVRFDDIVQNYSFKEFESSGPHDGSKISEYSLDYSPKFVFGTQETNQVDSSLSSSPKDKHFENGTDSQKALESEKSVVQISNTVGLDQQKPVSLNFEPKYLLQSKKQTIKILNNQETSKGEKNSHDGPINSVLRTLMPETQNLTNFTSIASTSENLDCNSRTNNTFGSFSSQLDFATLKSKSTVIFAQNKKPETFIPARTQNLQNEDKNDSGSQSKNQLLNPHQINAYERNLLVSKKPETFIPIKFQNLRNEDQSGTSNTNNSGSETKIQFMNPYNEKITGRNFRVTERPLTQNIPKNNQKRGFESPKYETSSQKYNYGAPNNEKKEPSEKSVLVNESKNINCSNSRTLLNPKSNSMTFSQRSNWSLDRDVRGPEKVSNQKLSRRSSPVSTNELKNILENAAQRQREKIEQNSQKNSSNEFLENEFVSSDLFDNFENILCEPDFLKEIDKYDDENEKNCSSCRNEVQNCTPKINFQNNFFTQNTINNVFGNNYQNNNYNNVQSNINCETSIMAPENFYENQNLEEDFNFTVLAPQFEGFEGQNIENNTSIKQEALGKYNFYNCSSQRNVSDPIPIKKPKLPSTSAVLKIFEYKKKRIMPSQTDGKYLTQSQRPQSQQGVVSKVPTSQPIRPIYQNRESNLLTNDQSQNYPKQWTNPIQNPPNLEYPRNVVFPNVPIENSQIDLFSNPWWVPKSECFDQGYFSENNSINYNNSLLVNPNLPCSSSQPFGINPYPYMETLNRFPGPRNPQIQNLMQNPLCYYPDFGGSFLNQSWANLYQNDFEIQNWMSSTQDNPNFNRSGSRMSSNSAPFTQSQFPTQPMPNLNGTYENSSRVQQWDIPNMIPISQENSTGQNHLRNLQTAENWTPSRNISTPANNRDNRFGIERQILGNYVSEFHDGSNNISGVYVSRVPKNQNSIFDDTDFIQKLKKINEAKNIPKNDDRKK